MVVGLTSLDREALVKILTEPKNALVRQYQRYFAMDGVELQFTPDALEAIAERPSPTRQAPAASAPCSKRRLMDVMYEIPGRGDVKKCIVNGDVIKNKTRPLLVTASGKQVEAEKLEESA